MKTILALSRTLPWPLDRGETIRLSSFLEAFRKSHDKVRWISIHSESDQKILPDLQLQYPDVSFSLVKIQPERGLSFSRSFFYPELLKRFNDSVAIKNFKTEIVQEEYSDLFFKGIQFVPWFTKEKSDVEDLSCKAVFDLDDIESKKMKRYIKTLTFGRGGYYLNQFLEWLRLLQLEKKYLKRFKSVLVTSEKDRIELESKNKLKNVTIIKNCVKIPTIDHKRVIKKSMLFLGSLGYDPNEDAVKYFLDDIFPIILKNEPRVKFHIVGSSPPRWLKNRHDDKNIFVLGYVESLQSVLTSSEIMVVPIRVGGGTRLKILDAAAHELPVISTTVGNEGLIFEDGKDILLANSPDDFAKKCLMLLSDFDLKNKLAENAKKVLEQNYSFAAVQEGIKQLF